MINLKGLLKHEGGKVKMPNTNRLKDGFSRMTAAAGAIVTIVEFVNLFRHEAGIKKELYCKHEDKLTTHVSISWNDVRDLRKKALEKNLAQLETLPTEADVVFMSLNPLSQKPYVCLSCSNLRWE